MQPTRNLMRSPCRVADFQALLDAAGPGSMDCLAGRLPDLRHYAALLTSVAAVVRHDTIRVPK